MKKIKHNQETATILKLRYSIEFNDGNPNIVAEANGDWESVEEAVEVAMLDLETDYLDRLSRLESRYKGSLFSR